MAIGASRIFVAGTGRSGTSQLADILGQHPQIHRIPIETRFIPDPGGQRHLADALTHRYDPIVGVKRHPVAVVASHVDQRLAPHQRSRARWRG